MNTLDTILQMYKIYYYKYRVGQKYVYSMYTVINYKLYTYFWHILYICCCTSM